MTAFYDIVEVFFKDNVGGTLVNSSMYKRTYA